MIVLVVGMHRSGTSLVGSILNYYGFNMGDTRVANQHNVNGYFEDKKFLELNKYILSSLGSSWYDLPSEEKIKLKSKEISLKYHSFFENLQLEKNLGFKDPRASIFLKFILKALPSDTKIIYCNREKDGVINSLREKFIGKDLSAYLFDRYNNSIKEALENKKYLLINYEDFSSDPKKNIKKIINFLKLEFDEGSLKLVLSRKKLKSKNRFFIFKGFIREIF